MDLTDANFEVNALVHDAVLLSLPYPEHEELLKEVKEIMVRASIKVVGGPIDVDHEIIFSNWKQEEEYQKSFDDIISEIKNYKLRYSEKQGTTVLGTGYSGNVSTPLSYYK